MTKSKKEWWIILGFAILKLAIHFLTNTNYELHRDAFLYYTLGEHPAWGYVSVPSFIAILSKVSIFLFGNTVFALRLFPALVGSLSVIVIGKMVKELNGGKWAIFIALIAFIFSPAFLRSNTLFQPVSFNQFFWLLSGLLILKLVKTQNSRNWIWLFLCFGVAFWNKYSISFLIISFLIALLLTKQRVLFRSGYFFIGGIFAVIIILPNLLWQHHYHWPLLYHMAELQKNQLVNVSVMDFMLGQVVMNFHALIIWLIGLFTFLLVKTEKEYRIFALLYLFTILFVALFNGKSYYTLGLYSILFVLGGVALEKYFKPWLRYGVVFLTVLISLPLLPFSLPVFSHEKMAEYSANTAEITNRWEDGSVHNLPQDYADMICWKELSEKVIETYNKLPERSKKNCFVFAEEYAVAGAITFYKKENKMPEPLSFSDNFLLWAPDSISPEVVIYVNHKIGDMASLFHNIRQVNRIENKYFRENGLRIYVCTQPVKEFPQFYSKKLASLKSKFQ
jgi:hypothetical protein